LAFDNDPSTGKPYISGNIINPERLHRYGTAKHLSKGTYSGVFSINLNGPKKADITEEFSYWNDGSKSFVNNQGYYSANDSYARQVRSFRDFEGNTYFVGSSFVKETKWGAIIASVATAPLLVPPVLF